MAKKTMTLPLVLNPTQKTYNIEGKRSEVEVIVTACPGQWTEFQFKWRRSPPAGIIAEVEGQFQLVKEGKSNRSAQKVRSFSDGRNYAPHKRFEKYELDGVDDHTFSGAIRERAQ